MLKPIPIQTIKNAESELYQLQDFIKFITEMPLKDFQQLVAEDTDFKTDAIQKLLKVSPDAKVSNFSGVPVLTIQIH